MDPVFVREKKQPPEKGGGGWFAIKKSPLERCFKMKCLCYFLFFSFSTCFFVSISCFKVELVYLDVFFKIFQCRFNVSSGIHRGF